MVVGRGAAHRNPARDPNPHPPRPPHPSPDPNPNRQPHPHQALCIALFTAEVLARLGLVATEPGKSCYGRAKGCLRMLCQPMTVVDIAALAPFYTGLYMIASGNEATQPHL